MIHCYGRGFLTSRKRGYVAQKLRYRELRHIGNTFNRLYHIFKQTIIWGFVSTAKPEDNTFLTKTLTFVHATAWCYSNTKSNVGGGHVYSGYLEMLTAFAFCL